MTRIKIFGMDADRYSTLEQRINNFIEICERQNWRLRDAHYSAALEECGSYGGALLILDNDNPFAKLPSEPQYGIEI